MNIAAEIKPADRALRPDFVPPLAPSHTSQPAAPMRRRPTPRRVLAMVAVLALMVVGWGVKAVLFPKAATNLVTAPVTIGNIDQTVLATGTLKPIKLVALGAQVSGRVVSLKVAIGQKVKVGELIAEINSLTQQNTLRTNEAALQNVAPSVPRRRPLSHSPKRTSQIYYNGIFNVPNPDGDLRTYMTAEVHIVLGEAHNVLTIPAGALGEIDADGVSKVKVVEPSGAVVTRAVKVGLSNKIMAEIRHGLATGERVVIGPSGTDAAPGRMPGPPPPGL